MNNPNKSPLSIAIVWPQKGFPGRSFIDVHTELLADIKCRIYTQWVPSIPAPVYFQYFLEGNPLLSPSLSSKFYFQFFLDNSPLFSYWKSLKHFFLSFCFHIPLDGMQERDLAKILLKKNINVVLAEFGRTAVIIMRACEHAKIPLVVHFHGADAYESSNLKNQEANYKELFRIASGHIAVSKDMKKQLISLGAPADKVFYNPYGVDTSLFKDATPAMNPPVFLGVARFVEKKGHFFTLYAFEKVLKQCPEAKLILIGDGPLLGSCKQLCSILKISDAVTFKGNLPHHEIVQYMRRARALLQHSIVGSDNNSEGTPVSILEAASCGLPVVATYHKGISEAVLHEKTGFLVKEKDTNAMAQYMLRLAQDPDLAANLGTHARQWAIQNYSLDKSLKNLHQILLHTANRR